MPLLDIISSISHNTTSPNNTFQHRTHIRALIHREHNAPPITFFFLISFLNHPPAHSLTHHSPTRCLCSLCALPPRCSPPTRILIDHVHLHLHRHHQPSAPIHPDVNALQQIKSTCFSYHSSLFFSPFRVLLCDVCELPSSRARPQEIECLTTPGTAIAR